MADPDDMPKIFLISLSVPTKGQKVTMTRDENVASREEALYLAAGVADLLADGLRGVARRLPGLAEVRQELRARGELALRRHGTEPLAHMEVLARRVAERTQDG
jgi:hypothetical protein